MWGSKLRAVLTETSDRADGSLTRLENALWWVVAGLAAVVLSIIALTSALRS